MEAPTAWEREHRPPHGPRTDDHATYEPPAAYGEDMLTLLVRDPRCVFAFWEVTRAGWEAAVRLLPHADPAPSLVLRVYDLTGHAPSADGAGGRGAAWDGADEREPHWLWADRRGPDWREADRLWADRRGPDWRPVDARGCADFDVAGAGSWYVHLETPGLVLAAEIGAKQGAAFVPIARSQPVATPPDRVSEEEDFDWMTVQHLYRFASWPFAGGASSPGFYTESSRRRHLELHPGPGAVGPHPGFSPGFAGGFSPGFAGGFSPGFAGDFSPSCAAGVSPGFGQTSGDVRRRAGGNVS